MSDAHKSCRLRLFCYFSSSAHYVIHFFNVYIYCLFFYGSVQKEFNYSKPFREQAYTVIKLFVISSSSSFSQISIKAGLVGTPVLNLSLAICDLINWQLKS